MYIFDLEKPATRDNQISFIYCYRALIYHSPSAPSYESVRANKRIKKGNNRRALHPLVHREPELFYTEEKSHVMKFLNKRYFQHAMANKVLNGFRPAVHFEGFKV